LTFSVGIAATITRFNFHEVEDLIKFSANSGVDSFCAFNFVPTGRGKDIQSSDISPIMREHLLNKLNEYLNKGDIVVYCTAPQYLRVSLMNSSVSKFIPINHYLVGEGGAAQGLARYLGGCGCGRIYCAIQPNGVVTPCVFMPIEVGDLRKEKLIDIWQNAPLMNLLRNRDNLEGHCKICEYRDFCGGCRARAYAYFGRVTAPDPGCIYNMEKRLYKEMIHESFTN